MIVGHYIFGFMVIKKKVKQFEKLKFIIKREKANEKIAW